MKRRLLVLLGLISILALALTPIFTDFVREVVVIPFLYILWIGRFLTDAVPQGVIWAFFIVFLLIIMLFSLSDKTRLKTRRRSERIDNQERIEAWLYLIRQSERDGYFKWRLAQHLQRLTIQAIAHQSDQTTTQTRQQLKQGDLDLPGELEAYFQASLKPLGFIQASRRFFSIRQVPPSPLDINPLRVAEFLGSLETDTITIQRRYDDG